MLKFSHKIYLSCFFWIKIITLKHLLRLFSLLCIGYHKISNLKRIKFFRMFIPVFTFVQNVKATFSSPSRFFLNLFLNNNVFVIYNRESSTQIFFAICVEIGLIIGYLLSHHVFLHVPHIKFLRTVAKVFNAIFHPLSGWATFTLRL